MVENAKQLTEMELAHIIELIPTRDLVQRTQTTKELNSGMKSLKAKLARFLDGMNDWPELTHLATDEETGEETWGPRDPEWIHVSKLPYFCERMETLLRLYPEQAERIDPGLRVVFNVGTEVHRLFQEDYFGRMRILHGGWRCRKCGHTVQGFMPKDQCKCSKACSFNCIWPNGFDASDRDCVKCPKSVSWEFMETKVRNENLRIKGRYDGELRFDVGPVLLEIKTMDTNQFKYLKSPLPKQVVQTRAYMRLGGFKLGLMVYVDKGGRAFPKFFPIAPDPEATGELFARIRDFWDRFDKAKRTGKIFPRTVCESKSKGLAVYCACAKLCFDSSLDRIHGVIDEDE